jgi:hypothetical protein
MRTRRRIGSPVGNCPDDDVANNSSALPDFAKILNNLDAEFVKIHQERSLLISL